MITIEQITELQKTYGYAEMQKLIDSGECWKFEGTFGRSAMNMLENGVCLLSEKITTDYYGNFIPSRSDVKEGSVGSLELAQTFWQKVLDGEIELDTEDEVE